MEQKSIRFFKANFLSKEVRYVIVKEGKGFYLSKSGNFGVLKYGNYILFLKKYNHFEPNIKEIDEAEVVLELGYLPVL